MTIRVCAIAAMDEGRLIGREGKLPWNIPEDMKHFSSLTMGHTVLMGRKTFESLPAKFRPLPGRKNVVISRNSKLEGVEVWDSLEKCLESYRSGAIPMSGDKLWVIGGAEIYKATLNFWDELYLTLVHSKHTGDAFFPVFESSFELVEEDKREGYSFQKYIRRR